MGGRQATERFFSGRLIRKRLNWFASCQKSGRANLFEAMRHQSRGSLELCARRGDLSHTIGRIKPKCFLHVAGVQNCSHRGHDDECQHDSVLNDFDAFIRYPNIFEKSSDKFHFERVSYESRIGIGTTMSAMNCPQNRTSHLRPPREITPFEITVVPGDVGPTSPMLWTVVYLPEFGSQILIEIPSN